MWSTLGVERATRSKRPKLGSGSLASRGCAVAGIPSPGLINSFAADTTRTYLVEGYSRMFCSVLSPTRAVAGIPSGLVSNFAADISRTLSVEGYSRV